MPVVFKKLQQSVGTPAMFFISIQRTELLAVCEEQSHGSMAQRVVEWNKTLTWRHTTSIASAMTCFSRSPSSLPLPLPSQNPLVLHEPSSPSEQTSQLLCTQPAEKKKRKKCVTIWLCIQKTHNLVRTEGCKSTVVENIISQQDPASQTKKFKSSCQSGFLFFKVSIVCWIAGLARCCQ